MPLAWFYLFIKFTVRLRVSLTYTKLHVSKTSERKPTVWAKIEKEMETGAHNFFFHLRELTGRNFVEMRSA
jgi:hypothetical protein